MAVIVILGVILTIALPSINGVVNRSKLNRLEEAAETFVSLAKQKLIKDVSIDYPSNKNNCAAGESETCYVVVLLDLVDKQQIINIYGQEYKDKLIESTPDDGGNIRKSKAVFSYDTVYEKWNNEFVVLYDGDGYAAYLDEDIITSNSNDQNTTLVSEDKYEGNDEGKGYYYVKVIE